ncbi:C-type lectin domain family 2 member D-like isoform X2 [Thamnophis elegans]|uniref:C-type lectin domain family 2 member D-like isoform X2 n=1 Tax=Thamnophis elegans TaxID=35005 RepID=UPI0013789F51|nr:C-type lectin domain family 2 member D-like isoform X2 [Thamnophis elegans]
MEVDIKGSGDSGCYDPLTSVVTSAFSSASSDTKHEKNVGQNGHLPGMHWGEGAESVPLNSEMTSEPSERPAISIRNAGGEGAERDAECCEHCIEVPTGPPPGCPDGIKNTARKHKYIIALVILVVVLIIIIIAISLAETCPSCPLFASQRVACPDFWVGYKGKCFYISKEEGNWSLSLKTCLSLNASLAVIDTQEELDFWVKFFHPLHYWFGLSREVNQTWKWSNGTEFKNQFPVRGEGFCAYLNGKRTDSSFCSMEKRFFCSRPESCRITG